MSFRKVRARDLWIRLLTARIETGEPYIINIDHVNRALPEHQKLKGLTVKTSNLCSEITLPTMATSLRLLLHKQALSRIRMYLTELVWLPR